MAYTQDWVNQLVKEAATQAGGTLSYDDALRAATNVGIPESQLLNAISTGLITDYGDAVKAAPEAPQIANAWQSELGVSPADIDYALSLAHLKAGGSLESGQQFLNDSPQGEAYDKYLAKFPASLASQNSMGSLVDVKQLMAPTSTLAGDAISAPSTGGGGARQTVGASNGQLMGAGNADYNSSLIKSLRQSSLTPLSNNAGIETFGTPGAPSSDWAAPNMSNAAFSPSVLSPRLASNQEVSDWNDYQAYKTNSIGAKTPILSMEEWIAKGRTDGKPAEQAPAQKFSADYF